MARSTRSFVVHPCCAAAEAEGSAQKEIASSALADLMSATGLRDFGG
jgi:hypothetical protein